MKLEKRRVGDLVPHPKNPMIHDKKNVAAISKSIDKLKYRDPIEISGDGHIVAGHGRVMALKELGREDEMIEVIIHPDLKGKDAEAYIIANNKTAQLSTWDDDALTTLLSSVDESDSDLILATGFTDKQLLHLLGDRMDVTQDSPKKNAKNRAKLGDIWILGNHRLMCGDSGAGDVTSLMGGKSPSLIVTSPPYNQSIDKFKPSGMHKDGGWVEKVSRLAYPDSMTESDYQNWQRSLVESWHKLLEDGGSLFYNHKIRYRDKRARTPLEWLPGPFNFRQEIIWSRPGSVTQNARMFLPSDERIYWLYKGSDFLFNDDTEVKSWSTVWKISPANNPDHAVAFPVEIPARAIRACSKMGAVVYDPFCGSGTTIIACEQLGRRCYGMEIDPSCVDVTLKRWENLTGKKAKRLRNK